MNCRCLSALFAALFALCLAGCAGSGGGERIDRSAQQTFAGHWTHGASVSVFTTLDGRNFLVLPEDMPVAGFQFLSSLPPVTDLNSPSGEIWCAYFEAVGRLVPLRAGVRGEESGQVRLRIDQIIRMDRARPEFAASLRR
ncbi:MAG: hypothetical protein JSR82_18660 [Verrucomicrobia bacterium]|nr:hypothetical protein [Verrucomicrobiota bacterium]